MKTVAIGDVHGCYTLLKQTIKPLIDTQSEVIFLGDLIDRSPEFDGDYKVVSYIKNIEQNPQSVGLSKVTVLRGNHEQLLLNALNAGWDSDAYDLWEYNGGNPAFYDKAHEFYDWIAARPYTYIKDDYLFVHAGVRPNVALENQKEHDFIWIRDPFLNIEDHGLPYTVVHGHTIVDEVEVHPKRINIDTGAFYTGNLSSITIDSPA